MKDIQQIIITVCAVIVAGAAIFVACMESQKTQELPVYPPFQEDVKLNTEAIAYMSGTESDFDDVVAPAYLDKIVSVSYKVHVNSETNRYVYHYKFKYNGVGRILLVWDVIDKIVNVDNGPSANPYLLEFSQLLKSHEFKFESNFPPSYHNSFVLAYKYNRFKDVWTSHPLNVSATPIPISAK